MQRYQPHKQIVSSAYIDESEYNQLYLESIKDPESFWAKQAEEFLSWEQPWQKVLDYDYSKAKIAWFLNGKINVAYNCVDRHLSSKGNQTAIIWEGNEPGEVRKISYQDLYFEVNKFANLYKSLGLKRGDKIAIYLPMVPELVFAMLACARLGIIHSIVFAGFSAQALKDRIIDCNCKLVVTANEALRGNKKIALKEIVDQALIDVNCVQKVLVLKRTQANCNMQQGRDLYLQEELEQQSRECVYEIMDSEDPLFILYTSGSTGKPKGVLHTQAGYLLYAAITHKYIFDYHDNDVYFCAADIGWITGHSYIVYGPLANGATTLMFESIPTYPDAGRYWDVIERHKVNIFYTAPTAIRAVAKAGSELPKNYDLSSLKVIGSVGEPINKDAWEWYYKQVGNSKCALVDTWWQTETGGILISPLPGATELIPSYACKPFFGVQPCIVDDQGNEILETEASGKLCIKFPWPGQMRTVYGDHQRFFDTYFKTFTGKYFTGDACERDKDGNYKIKGRVDDVLNVSGHRLGTAELESAIVSSGIVAEAAVVGKPHEIKGEAIVAFCILKNSELAGNELDLVTNAVKVAIGSFAVPDQIYFVSGLPKTRSGKIMRRILKKLLVKSEDLGDLSTLAEPQVVDDIRAIILSIYLPTTVSQCE